MSKNKLFNIAAPVDLSKGFEDFFDSIDMTGTGLVTKGIGAAIVIIGGIMAFRAIKRPKTALQQGLLAVGVLMTGLVLVLFGSDLFGTISDPTPAGGGGN